jgi:hypothetical protein
MDENHFLGGKPLKNRTPRGQGVPLIFVYPKSYFLCDLLHAKFQNPSTTPTPKGSALTPLGPINGFLSLQLELRLELGLRLRLTNTFGITFRLGAAIILPKIR